MRAGAQIPGADTLFRPAELYYFSGLEEESFAAFFEGTPDYLSLITAVDPTADKNQVELYRERIDDIALHFRDKKFERLSKEKKTDQIKNHVSKTLLGFYDHRAGFGELFRSGQYNYQTAAATYSLIFEKLGIPYEIRELPEYVCMFTYPEDRRIMLEIAPPGLQYFMLEYETRNKFVEFLYNNGIIDEPTFRNTGTRKLFEKYYFTDHGLGLREIAGMLYLNSAITYLEKEDLHNAYFQLEKAFLLYPSHKTQFLLMAQLYGFLQDMDYHNPRDLGYLAKAARLIGYGVDPGLINAYFTDIIDTLLDEEGDEKAMLYTREYIHRYFPEAQVMEFEFLYQYECGMQNFLDANYARALDHLEAAFRIFPEDENNQNLLVAALSGYATIASPAMVLRKIEEYDTAFTELESEDVLTLVKANTFLQVSGESFQLQDREAGEEYMSRFEDILDRNPYLDISHVLIGRSYSSAAIYYYRSGMIGKTREVLLKGLGYAPGNIDLKLKLNSLE